MEPKITEAKILRQCISWLEQQPGVFAWRTNVQGVPLKGGGYRKAPMRGTSDIICIYYGRAITIEVKKPDGKISVFQKKFMENVLEAEGYPVVVYSLDDLKSVFRELSGG